MVDSVSAAVGREFAAGVADLPVVPESGGECEESECDARGDAGDGAAVVAFEGELAFAGPEDGFDPLAQRAERSEAGRSPLRSGRRKSAPRLAMNPSNSSPAKPLSAITV